MISTRNVVTVDLDIVTDKGVLGDFETVVYFAPVTLNNQEGTPVNVLPLETEDQLDGQVTGNDTVVQSIKNYFKNGGEKIIVVSPTEFDLSEFIKFISQAKTITRDFIYVCISNQLIGSSGYQNQVLQEIAGYCDATKSPDKIRLLLTTNSKTFITDMGLTKSYSIVKYCTKTYDAKILDAALLVGAYFSKIDLDKTDSIKDYCYTSEKLYGTEDGISEENLTQQDFDSLVKNGNDEGYYNVIDKIANSVVNFGGNLATTDNIAIHTDFGAIACERDITYSVLEQMLGKQYLTEAGMTKVKSAINSQLQRYKTNGYLNVGASYSGEDLTITYNSNKYSVIKHGETLQQGFYIFSVPVSDITPDDKVAKRFTPIYVILETQSGARVVEITGEIR